MARIFGDTSNCIDRRDNATQRAPHATLATKARAIHERVMALDTHVDIDPGNFQVGTLNYSQRLATQVDLTKMEEGGLDAVFFSIFVGQGALDSAGFARAYATDTAKFNAVHRLAEEIAPNRIAIAYTADAARRIYAGGKKVAFMGVENGYGIGNDIGRVKEFHDRGARYMSLAHNGHSQLSDSNTGEANNDWMWHGLSPLGTQVIAIAERYPQLATATVKDFVDHIDYAVKLIGLDHVGVSSDFDGGGGVEGFNCALESINVTTELVRRGYTEEQIGKIWSGNLLRVMGEVEKSAKRIQAGELKS